MSIKQALISVSDKTGVVDLARSLHHAGVTIISTGGTAKLLQAENIPVTEISDYTGFPEMLDGRVKTLHPKVHAGILARDDLPEHKSAMKNAGITDIELVIVNLYPFSQTIVKDDCSLANAIENIDIGGPAMVRSAAKNHNDVLVVVNPGDYDEVIGELDSGLSLDVRRRFAITAFRHTAEYDATIAAHLGREDQLPASISLAYEKIDDMRYGENPHQQAAFYREAGKVSSGNIANYRQHQGKALSYNNIADTDAALECVKVFEAPACVIVKHANPCGVGEADSLSAAYEKAFATDTTSAFGGIIAFNRPLESATLELILDRQFVEVVIAPEVSDAAIELAQKKKNLRLLTCGPWDARGHRIDFKRVGGGLLVQTADDICLDDTKWQVVSQVKPSDAQLRDLLFAWKVAWFVKSNAIVYAKDLQTIGVGAGQMARVISAKIAGMKAEEEGLTVPGSVMASDAFFPFRDSIDTAASDGIAAIIQPGGSMRDEEVIAAADEHGLAMVFTGIRHFRH